jgi:hypothetical protein
MGLLSTEAGPGRTRTGFRLTTIDPGASPAPEPANCPARLAQTRCTDIDQVTHPGHPGFHDGVVDPIETLLTDALAAEQIDRADLERIVAASPEHDSAVERVRVVFPEWRLGQAYMNVLRVARPELYLEVTSSEVDCFYADAKVPALVRWLQERSSADPSPPGRRPPG